MKNLRVTFLVSVEIECTEPQSFNNLEDFAKQDGKEMIKYLKEKINDEVLGSYNYAAKVDRVKIQVL